MRSHKRFFAVFLSVCVLCIFTVYYYLRFSITNRYWHSGVVGEVNHNAHIIGNAIVRYQKDHGGNLPDHLSELVPDYIDSSSVAYFFWPPINKKAIQMSLDSKSIFKKIDDEGAYIYLGTRGCGENIILYDRTNLWPPGQSGTTVVTLTTNCTTLLRSVDDVNSRLSRLAVK